MLGVHVLALVLRLAAPGLLAVGLPQLRGAAQGPAPHAAFAVYSPNATTLVPVADAGPQLVAAGLWLLDGARARALFTAPSRGGERCGCHGSTCRVGQVHDVPVGLAAPLCACVRPERDPAEEDDEDDEEDDCYDEGHAPVSLLGGALHWLGSSHSVCGGLNIYGAVDRVTPIVVGADWLVEVRSRLGPVGCIPDTGSTGEPERPWPPGEPSCVRVGDLWRERSDEEEEEDDDDPEERAIRGPPPTESSSACHDCTNTPETAIWLLRRGRLWRIEDDVAPVGLNTRWIASVAATPEICPSPADPCGDTFFFSALAAGDDEFWVASDQQAALVVSAAGLAVVRSGEQSARPRGPAPKDIIGVHYYRDARPLRAAIRRGPPVEAPPCRTGEAR